VLRNEKDLARFEGELIDITLKAPLGEAAAGLVNATRKKFRGTLEKADAENTWQIVWSDAPEPKPGARVSKNRPPVTRAKAGCACQQKSSASAHAGAWLLFE